MIIIIIVFLLVIIIYNLSSSTKNHIEGMTSDDSLQLLGTIYNTGIANTNTLQANSLTIGNKWKLSATGDAFANDDWFRIMRADGTAKYSGADTDAGLAAAQLHSQTDIEAASATIGGTLNVGGDASVGNIHLGATLDSGGRMHISPGTDDLYLIPKKGGIIIGKHWGGNGNLTVQGDLNVAGTITN
jgi:hypothetical protein